MDPAVNEATLAELRSLNPEDPQFLRELVELFFQDIPLRFADLELALTQGNAALLTRAAHTIKGSCSNFGAVQLADIALRLEQHGKTGTFAEARLLVPSLHAEYARVEAALRQAC
jgi:HPt (histidine-containing phosphotransfer) domain-containing protein